MYIYTYKYIYIYTYIYIEREREKEREREINKQIYSRLSDRQTGRQCGLTARRVGIPGVENSGQTYLYSERDRNAYRSTDKVFTTNPSSGDLWHSSRNVGNIQQHQSVLAKVLRLYKFMYDPPKTRTCGISLQDL